MKQIDSYFYDHDSSPLRMVDSEGSTPSLPIITNLDDLVLWVIKAAASCSTYDDTDYQCRAGASRSSGDIWRIIKHYRDDVSVLQVIAAMVRLAQEHRIGLMKCYDIGKYVCYSDIYTGASMSLRMSVNVMKMMTTTLSAPVGGGTTSTVWIPMIGMISLINFLM